MTLTLTTLTKTMFSHDSDDWTTPDDFYKMIDKQFHFTLDPCATKQSSKCKTFFTIEDDGLKQDWKGHVVFCNPPYSNNKEWIKKCYEESQKPNTKVVLLCPVRTDTKYFHNYCMKASELHFIKGRLKFGGGNNSAPFPSMIVVFSLVTTMRFAEPKSCKVAFSSVKPTSSEMTFAPVNVAISCNMALRRSPKPGAFTATTFTIPRIVLTTSVANASPSTSSATINKGLPDFATPSNIGNNSRMLLIFLSTNKM